MLLNPRTHPLDLPNADGERCLHIAVRHNNIEMARKLLDNGANPNLPDRKSGRTPLHEAANLGHTEMVKYLISRDEVDINETTYNDETALEIAHMRGRTEIVTLLKHHSFPITKRKSKTDIPTG
jgi:ankyrin repeat protein